MRWLESAGIQFDFESLEPGPVPAGRFFCTAHVSMKRELFERAGGFDERFPDAAIEDIELGVRLEERGAELDYHPELLVLHTHPTDPDRSVARLGRVGRSAALLHEIRPEGAPLDVPSGPKWSLIEAAGPLWRLLSERGFPAAVRRLGWRGRHMRAYRRGYLEGPPPVGGAG
jgi:GT2 family glycosyltransferase